MGMGSLWDVFLSKLQIWRLTELCFLGSFVRFVASFTVLKQFLGELPSFCEKNASASWWNNLLQWICTFNETPTVDRRNPANQLRLVVYPIIQTVVAWVWPWFQPPAVEFPMMGWGSNSGGSWRGGAPNLEKQRSGEVFPKMSQKRTWFFLGSTAIEIWFAQIYCPKVMPFSKVLF